MEAVARRTPLPIEAIGRVERRQVKLVDGVDDKPRQVPLGQPLAQVGRQQQHLLTVTLQEVRTHSRIVLTAPDKPASCATASLAAAGRP
jgi:hypothetical protein